MIETIGLYVLLIMSAALAVASIASDGERAGEFVLLAVVAYAAYWVLKSKFKSRKGKDG